MKLGSCWQKSSQYWNCLRPHYLGKNGCKILVQTKRSISGEVCWALHNCNILSCCKTSADKIINLAVIGFFKPFNESSLSNQSITECCRIRQGGGNCFSFKLLQASNVPNLEENCFNFRWVVCALPSWNATWIRIFNTLFRLAGSPPPPP